MSATEKWRPIPGWPGYEASSLGRIVSRRRPTPVVLRGSLNNSGYLRVSPNRDGKATGKTLHGLVALTWLGPRPAGMEVRHLDGNKLNNAVANLAYGTRADNVQDAIDHGAFDHCRWGHRLAGANLYRDEDGAIWCRTCRAAYEAWHGAA